MDCYILVCILKLMNPGHADVRKKKHRGMGCACAERYIRFRYAYLVHHLSLDIPYGLFETCI